MSLTVRAPEGDSPRAILMRKLVSEMKERNETGHLREWMIDALLDRVARDSLPSEHVAYPSAAIQAQAGGSELVGPAVQPEKERAKGQAEQAVREPSVETGSSTATRSVPLPKGLRAM